MQQIKVNPVEQIGEIFDEIENKIAIIAEYAKKNNIYADVERLKLRAEDEKIWEDPTEASKILQEYNKKRKFVEELNSFDPTGLRDLFDELAEDDPMREEVYQEVVQLNAKVEKTYISTLYKDKHDDFACFITITAGSGGLEAQDWAMMLFEMYHNFAKQSPVYSYEIIEYSEQDVGLKSGVLKLTGPSLSFPYGRLKGETGVHRLVRPSPFNANNKRHTSFSSVIVTPVIDDSITVVINESDLRIDTYRSSGAGGQHVNTTDSAVRITHVPTGVVAQCQNDRSQHRNKAEAMAILKSRLYMHEEEKRKQETGVEKHSISWGNQIRSYVLDDSRVKDLRTGTETAQPDKVLSGDIDMFLDAYIKWNI